MKQLLIPILILAILLVGGCSNDPCSTKEQCQENIKSSVSELRVINGAFYSEYSDKLEAELVFYLDSLKLVELHLERYGEDNLTTNYTLGNKTLVHDIPITYSSIPPLYYHTYRLESDLLIIESDHLEKAIYFEGEYSQEELDSFLTKYNDLKEKIEKNPEHYEKYKGFVETNMIKLDARYRYILEATSS